MTGTYTFSPDYIISNGTEVSATDLTGVGGGNVSFKLLINVGGTSQDVAMTTLSGDTINTNHTEIGISGGNSFSFGEGIRFDLVNGLTLIDNPNPTPDSFSYNGTHNLVSRWEESVTGMSPGEKANFTLSVFNANSDNVFYGDTNDTQINLDPANIRVYDASHNLVANNTQGLTITDSGDSVLVTGLQNGWSYEIVTDDAHQFSAVQLDAATGTDTFKLGFFDYGTTSAGTPIDLSYSIVGTDGDGDQVSGEINVSLYPDSMTMTATDASPNLTGDSSDNILLGTSGNNDLGGAGGNDTLVSGAGSDTLSGGDGNDLLIGGSGNDMLTGGMGTDTFKWVLGDALSTTVPVDHITDWGAGGVADKLDLRDLLQGETHVGTDPGTLANYLHFTAVNSGADTAIQVKSHGATGVVDQVIVLDGVGDLTAGGANTDAAIITALLTANKLIVD
ncbi:MAG TPA: type I secretion C-terminal target domain-containing protein, partial [Burkholderiales bacterium]|nr:type I secretion C-terminal target domain-containing protein [Burkholderiales bacterium]